MQCPVCVDQQLSISSREGVEIDFCPQCRGVWLDRGELDKIIDRAAPDSPPAPAASAPRYDERPRDDRPRYEDRERDRYDDRDRYDKKRRRKSFLEEIFDFD